jgi:hypothetical protein
MAVGLASRKLAERAVYSALILIFLGGVLGTGRYWAGGPNMRVPLGSMFSTTMCSKPWRGSNRSRRCISPTTSHQHTRLAKTHGFAVTGPTRRAASFIEAFPVDLRTRETTLQYIERVLANGWLRSTGTALDAV